MEDKGQVIIFEDLLESQFNDDYQMMLDWLNEHNCWKEVIYISREGQCYEQSGEPYIVGSYIGFDKYGNEVNVMVTMHYGGSGPAKGLIFINRDFVGKNNLGDDDTRIKWYVNGRLIDDK